MVYQPMSEVVSFKVPKELKKKMREYADRVKWSEELRRYVINRIEEIEREDNLKKVIGLIESTAGVPKGFSSASVREDRDP